MGRLGELSENSTSKANFCESMSMREAQAIAPVTANSGAFSGLDKGGTGKDVRMNKQPARPLLGRGLVLIVDVHRRVTPTLASGHLVHQRIRIPDLETIGQCAHALVDFGPHDDVNRVCLWVGELDRLFTSLLDCFWCLTNVRFSGNMDGSTGKESRRRRFPWKGLDVGTRLGPGPVFVYEWLTTTRRWQHYAVRAAFVSAILAGMALISKAFPVTVPLYCASWFATDTSEFS